MKSLARVPFPLEPRDSTRIFGSFGGVPPRPSRSPGPRNFHGWVLATPVERDSRVWIFLGAVCADRGYRGCAPKPASTGFPPRELTVHQTIDPLVTTLAARSMAHS